MPVGPLVSDHRRVGEGGRQGTNLGVGQLIQIGRPAAARHGGTRAAGPAPEGKVFHVPDFCFHGAEITAIRGGAPAIPVRHREFTDETGHVVDHGAEDVLPPDQVTKFADDIAVLLPESRGGPAGGDGVFRVVDALTPVRPPRRIGIPRQHGQAAKRRLRARLEIPGPILGMRVAWPVVVMPDGLADGVVAIPEIPVHVRAQPVCGSRGPKLLSDVLEVPVVGYGVAPLVALDPVPVENPVL